MDKRHRNVMTILALGNCTRSLRRFVIKCLGDDTDELVSDVVGEEVTEVHDGSVILTREPWLLLALAFTADVESFLLGCMALLHKIVTANLWVEIN